VVAAVGHALDCRRGLLAHGPRFVSFAAAGAQQPDGLARMWRVQIIVAWAIACQPWPGNRAWG